ncbi:MAG: hypothetical protein AAF215_23350 [Cyanobacteria bacterium P01_A01_bin.123]
MNPITKVEEALLKIDQFFGTASELRLPISDSLNDSVGINMAIITDKILAKGWIPNGFEAKDGYRVYLYQASDPSKSS